MVAMMGTTAAVKSARAAITKLLEDALNEESMPVPAASIGAIIGKGGETIRKISTESGARLSIDREDNAVKLGGSKEQVKKVSRQSRWARKGCCGCHLLDQ
eukprot:COSAG02_NODE_21749_length_776_cov_1.146233_2_plen_101_part_00